MCLFVGMYQTHYYAYFTVSGEFIMADSLRANVGTTQSIKILRDVTNHVTSTTDDANCTLRSAIDIDHIIELLSDSEQDYNSNQKLERAPRDSLTELDMNISNDLDSNINSQMCALLISPAALNSSGQQSANSSNNTSGLSSHLFSSTPNIGPSPNFAPAHHNPSPSHMGKITRLSDCVVSSTSLLNDFNDESLDDCMLTSVMDKALDTKTPTNRDPSKIFDLTELSPEMAAIMDALCDDSSKTRTRKNVSEQFIQEIQHVRGWTAAVYYTNLSTTLSP